MTTHFDGRHWEEHVDELKKFFRRAYNPFSQNRGGDMRARWCVILIVAIMIVVTSCSDGGPNLPTQSKDWLALFKRVTLAADEPGRAEIEIEVRTGPEFSQPAPDGTKIHVETTLGSFVGGDRHIETTTMGGRALVTLDLPDAAHLAITARTHDVEAHLAMVVTADGSLQLGPF